MTNRGFQEADHPSDWVDALDIIRPYIFRVETPSGSGTGFFLTFTTDPNGIGIATALHVVRESHEWDGPIRLHHLESGVTRVVRPPDRAMKVFSERDLAFIVVPGSDFPVPTTPLELATVKENDYLVQGVSIGWCGFPCVALGHLCFFSGHISAYVEEAQSYIVDGVAINGVSGAPAFVKKQDGRGVQLCGVVTAYIPNRTTGETLPGVCWVQNISPYARDYIPF